MDLPTVIVTRQVVTVEVDGRPWRLASATVSDVNALADYAQQPDYNANVWSLGLIQSCCSSADHDSPWRRLFPRFYVRRLRKRVLSLTQVAVTKLVEVAVKVTYPKPPEGSDPKAAAPDSAGPR